MRNGGKTGIQDFGCHAVQRGLRGYNGGANTEISSGTFKLTPGCADAAQRKPPRRHTTTN